MQNIASYMHMTYVVMYVDTVHAFASGYIIYD